MVDLKLIVPRIHPARGLLPSDSIIKTCRAFQETLGSECGFCLQKPPLSSCGGGLSSHPPGSEHTAVFKSHTVGYEVGRNSHRTFFSP